jgi:hypothetical protein
LFNVDIDGIFYLDFLKRIQYSDPDNLENILRNIRKEILLNLNETQGIYKKFQKWAWLSYYFDKKVNKLKLQYPKLENMLFKFDKWNDSV